MQDLRFAVRQLRKDTGFAGTAILVLALGIAAAVSIFGFVDAALIRPLPYQDPTRLVTVFGSHPAAAQGQRRGSVSYLDFLEWRERSRAFSSMAAYDVRAGFTVTTPTGPQRVAGLRVTSGFFRTLGVTPILGREFHRGEEGASAPPTVMLSYSAWQTRFGARPDVIGQTVTLQSPWLADGEPHVVIGVLPRGFHFTMAEHAELWATIRGRQACWDVRTCRSLEAVARLADHVSLTAAAADTSSLLEQIRSEYPGDRREPEIARLIPLREVLLGDVRPTLLMFLGAAGLLFLIACINVVTLVLARADSRTREIAVRHALGASWARLVLQFATEAVVLAVAGGLCGLILAVWTMYGLAGLLSADMIARMPYMQGIGVNIRLIAFACGVSLAGAVVFALTPMVRLSLSGLAGLTDGSRGASGTTWRRLGAPLVVAELAVAMVLLASAGLLGKSLYRLLHVSTGFNTAQLLTLSVSPATARPRTDTGDARGASQETPGALARQVAERVAALPGIVSVGYADLLPLGPGLAPTSTFWIPGRPDQQQLKVSWPVRRIGPGYFAALQGTLMRGREFTGSDVTSTRLVIIINETAARRYFAGEDPIGRSMAFGGPQSPVRQIVGVVADIKDGPPETPPIPAAYVPFDGTSFGLVVRAAQPGGAVVPSVVAAVHEVRPGLLVQGATTMTEQMTRLPSTSMNRASAWLVGGFAALAFVLSVVGLYGVVAYSVGRRTREIGVRMALGAQRGSVYRLIVGEAGWLVGIGTGLGLICAVSASSLMRRLLFDVQAWDPATLGVAAGILVVSALAASYVPAQRAASVNPIDVLRAD